MFELSVCIDAIFHQSDLENQLLGAQEAGYSTVEFWSWWDKDLDLIESFCQHNGITIAAFCTRFISLVDPSYREAYLTGLKESIAIAKRLNCKTLISQVGDDTGALRSVQQASLITGLKEAASLLEESDITLAFEPLNVRVDHPGYYLVQSDEAFEIAHRVGSSHVKVLFDIYHQQISEGDVSRRITENIDLIAHFHAAGNPGRHELDTGELNYASIFSTIYQAGFNGYVGLEYYPLNDPISGLEAAKNQF